MRFATENLPVLVRGWFFFLILTHFACVIRNISSIAAHKIGMRLDFIKNAKKNDYTIA
jgi:hypothetical protein